ncbi:Uma2 family endonuclease [Oscillatoria sp. CS-180]|uniref:Uma2 family endonuclease n=1 Tax=Oscillatoria sp. CS-180 TaxID=3021720 RepID=UPI00232D0134|nr:Uma2 family endonuclease [Oscillatoria sp. CS-180]MDB9526538.1 Uma2 family endonuclease [Oscillatoria sp. CS-180]
MVQSPAKALTLQEFLKQPETQPASEYINGQIIQKPMPKGKHSLLQTRLSAVLNAALQPEQVAWALAELRCTFGGRSIVPDISVFTWSRIPCDANGEIANTIDTHPDWTIEILSPEQSQTRVTKNILHCLQHGSKIGWLIDPDEQTVLVYLPPEQVKIFDQPADRLPTPTFASNIHLTIEELFGWLVIQLPQV